MKTSDQVEYMVLPRLFALAEVVWTQAELKDWRSFKKRVPNQYHLIRANRYQAREATLAEIENLELNLWHELKGYWTFGLNYLPLFYYEVFQKEGS